jgi:hypothetical protein
MKSAIDWTEVRGRLARAEQGLAASLLPDQARTDALLRRRADALATRPRGEIGLRVDHAEGAQEIDLATLTAPQGGEGPLRGSTPDRVQVLDVEALLGRLEP